MSSRDENQISSDQKSPAVQGKHLMNNLETAVGENLLGFVLHNPHLQLIPSLNTIVSREVAKGECDQKCLILSGAGSGHEPLAHGFVGPGGLAASVAGEVFASPSTGQVIETIRLLAGRNHDHEVFVVVNNYTGDRLNFGLAVEQAKLEGVSTDLFCFGDDVAFCGSKREGIKTGKRGLAGCILLNKCLGSLAKRGCSLSQLMNHATELTNKIGTMSVSVTSCDVPGSGTTFELGPDEMELGLGIHGESGILRTKLLASNEVVSLIMDNLLDPNKSPIAHALTGDADKRVAVLVNNLGGLSNFELNIVSRDIIEELERKSIKIERILVGSYVTSFSMNGFSISLMQVDDDIINLLDDEALTSVFSSAPVQKTQFQVINSDPVFYLDKKSDNKETVANEWINVPGCSQPLLRSLLKVAAESMVANEGLLNQLDRIGGDGDCGLTCKKGALAILKLLNSETTPRFLDLAAICSQEMGGTSGAIYSLLFTSIHASLLEHAQKRSGTAYGRREIVTFWSQALNHAIQVIKKYSWAEVGDRTMLESLHATHVCLGEFVTSDTCGESIKVLASRLSNDVKTAAEETAGMAAKAGRASYVDASRIVNQPDPGAIGVSIWMNAIADYLIEKC